MTVGIGITEDIVVEPLRRADTSEASAVLGEAFVTNPNTAAVWGRQGRTEQAKQAAVFRILKLQRPWSTVLVARRGEEIVGVLNVARWPHCQISAREMIGFIPRLMLVSRLALLRGALGRAARLQRMWGEHDPQEPHWHLGPVGVLPTLQGRGVGSRLMDRFCEIVDAAGDAAYLETDRIENLPFYERFGFIVTGEASINDAPNWFMRRDVDPKGM